MNLYVRDDVIQSIPLVLLRVGGEGLFDRFKAGPFQHLLEIRRNGSANNALHELLARELEDDSIPEFERWFHVGGRDIRFSRQEYAIVTGLAFGESAFNPNAQHSPPKSSLLHTKYEGKSPTINQLKEDFNDELSVLGTEDQYLKAANLLMYYLMLAGHDNPTIHDWAWYLVEFENQWNSFPWGAWSFQILHYQLRVMKRDPGLITNLRGAYHLYGPVWALNIWAYEAIPRMGQACGRRDLPTLSPRLRRWATSSSSCNFIDFFDNPQLEVHTTLEVDEHDVLEYAVHSLDSIDPMGVAYVPSKRHEQTNLPPEKRVSKVKRDMAKAMEKLKCRDNPRPAATRRRALRAGRAHSDGGVGMQMPRVDRRPEAWASKRPRTEHADPRPSGLICCAHGDPCVRGPPGDDFLDRFGDRLVSRWEQDRSGTGFLSGLARALAGS